MSNRHLIDGEFQSDKYPTTPRGKVPLSVRDVTAQPLLWEYAQIRRAVDREFADALEIALRHAGFLPPEPPEGPRHPFNVRCTHCDHTWPSAWLPMDMARFARLTMGIQCPNCGQGGRSVVVAQQGVIG